MKKKLIKICFITILMMILFTGISYGDIEITTDKIVGTGKHLFINISTLLFAVMLFSWVIPLIINKKLKNKSKKHIVIVILGIIFTFLYGEYYFEITRWVDINCVYIYEIIIFITLLDYQGLIKKYKNRKIETKKIIMCIIPIFVIIALLIVWFKIEIERAGYNKEVYLYYALNTLNIFIAIYSILKTALSNKKKLALIKTVMKKNNKKTYYKFYEIDLSKSMIKEKQGYSSSVFDEPVIQFFKSINNIEIEKIKMHSEQNESLERLLKSIVARNSGETNIGKQESVDTSNEKMSDNIDDLNGLIEQNPYYLDMLDDKEIEMTEEEKNEFLNIINKNLK